MWQLEVPLCFCADSEKSRFEWVDKELNFKLFFLTFSWEEKLLFLFVLFY